MKKIAFLVRNLKGSGVRRVVENLLYEFDKFSDIKITLLTDNNIFLDKYNNIEVVVIKGNVLLWDYVLSFKYLKLQNFDTIIYPKGTIPFTHKFLNARKLYIVHDLGYFVKRLKAYKWIDTLYMTSMMKFSCNTADKIFAISEYTKKDIMKMFSISESKIVIAYEGVEDKFKRENDQKEVYRCLKKYNINKPYIFYAGSISPRKNLLRTLQAFNIIKDKVKQNLVITGNNSWGNTGVNEYVEKNLKGRVDILGFIPSEDLIVLYSSADLYIYPSLYEGFGLPTLEAQVCGCPVISSNVTSLPEVGGNAVEYFDPYSVSDIACTMLNVLNSRKIKMKLIKSGYENVKRFSWNKMANIIKKEF